MTVFCFYSIRISVLGTNEIGLEEKSFCKIELRVFISIHPTHLKSLATVDFKFFWISSIFEELKSLLDEHESKVLYKSHNIQYKSIKR